MKQEFKVLENAIRLANKQGAYEIEESYNIFHCLNVVKSGFAELDGIKEELDKYRMAEAKKMEVVGAEEVENAVQPIQKRPTHKQNPGPSKTGEAKNTPKTIKALNP